MNDNYAFYDSEDGEWVTWDWVNDELHKQDIQAEWPEADPDLVMLFEDLLAVARTYKSMTGRYLQIWGELGEFYAEIRYGLKLNKAHQQGSDGRKDNDYYEIKTISPEKSDLSVLVKRDGNFNKLIVVKIDENFEIESRMIDRKQLKKGEGKYARTNWVVLPVATE